MDRTFGSFILIYVDDLFIFAKTVTTVDRLAVLLGKKSPLRELEDVSWFLGCRIIRNPAQRKICIVHDAWRRDFGIATHFPREY